ncbi:MAG TPA: hypothetical protein VGL24_04345 [Chthoniobacterales bacterium]
MNSRKIHAGSGAISEAQNGSNSTPPNRVRRPSKTRRAHVVTDPEDEVKRPAAGTLTRTRNLLLAALRVWELKQGIRS